MLRQLLIASIFIGLAGCATAPQAQLQPDAAGSVAAPAAAPVSTYLDKSLRVEGLIVGGQIQDIDLAKLKSAGVTRVVNLRTPEEMQALG